jgi:hypothetical protein
VRCGIVEAEVGFDFDDTAAEPFASAAMYQDLAEDVACDDVRRAQEKVGREHGKL